MPTQFSSLDTGFPTFTGRESTEQKVEALHGFTYMLLEYLRYILRNLGPENFNETDLKQMYDEIRAGVVVSNTVIVQELYAEYGAIADLVVNELRTDYMRASRYLASPQDLSDIDYIHIYDEELTFINAQVKFDEDENPLTEQLHHGDRYFYWTDASMTQMTSEKTTAWPVIVFQYDETVKASIAFATISGYATPVITLGAGNSETPDTGKAYIYKTSDGLRVRYYPENAVGLREIRFDNNGNVYVLGPLILDSSLQVYGSLSVGGALQVSGTSDFYGDVTFHGGVHGLPEPEEEEE